MLVIPLRDRESSSTTARDQKHLEILLGLLRHSGSFSRSIHIQSTLAMPLDAVRAVQVVSYLAGAIAALTAVWVYKSNSRRERARWAESLYARFYEREELKRVRDLLDCDVGDPQVSQLVTAESSVWTDYLNFFEFVAYLQSSNQLHKEDVDALFSYYLACLKRHSDAVGYIRNKEKGYEYLRRTLLNE